MEYQERDVGGILIAIHFAAEKHRDQKRKGRTMLPYINHPIEVADLLWKIGGVRDTHIIVAAILHDTLEDTDATQNQIESMFGEKILSLVEEVTDDKSLPKAERRRRQVEHASTLSLGAKLIKLGDKISNILAIIDDPPEKWSPEDQREYVEWGLAVINGLRGANKSLESYFDTIVDQVREKIASRASVAL